MEDHERQTLIVIAAEAARAVYNSLMDARRRASTNLFNARLMGDVAGPELIKQREQELENAKERLRAWAAANPSTGHYRWFAPENDERRFADLAAQIGATAEASVRDR